MPCRAKCPTCELLQAQALRLVVGAGARGLSIEALGERTGLGAEQIQAHYPTATACLYDAYDAASEQLLRAVFDSFDGDVSWEQAFDTATRRLLARALARPLEARLCFVEAPRVDRELRRRCELRRRELVEFLASEHERRRHRDRLSGVQLELLVGAGFHAVSEAIVDGDPDRLARLHDQLAELAGAFDLAAAA